MAGELLIALVLGGLAGSLASLVPGLHVNTLASIALVLATTGTLQGPGLAPGLLAALGASTIVSIVPLVALGVPEGADAPALLPGQRLARTGRARPALVASATGSLTGLVVTTGLALPLMHALQLPTAPGLLARLAPWVAGLALALLVLTDGGGPARALVVAGLAGLLGVLALDQPAPSPLGLSSTVLLPLFLGLFGMPALALAAQAPPLALEAPEAAPARSRTGLVGPGLGALLGLLAGLFPGFTTGPATALATLVRQADDEALIATTSAVNTGVAVTATVALHALARTRTGVHAAQLALGSRLGTADRLLADLGHVTAGVLAGLVVLGFVAGALGRLGHTVPRLALGLIPLWLALVWALTGWMGLLVAASGWAVAWTAAAAGCRRSLLMATLLVPTVLRGLGVA